MNETPPRGFQRKQKFSLSLSGLDNNSENKIK